MSNPDNLVMNYYSNATSFANATINIKDNCLGPKAIADLIITKFLFGLTYVLIFTLAVSGNTLVVYVVLSSKSMQTVTNIFITNLAISDLLVNFTSLWLTPLYSYVGYWVWGGWLCYGLPLFQGTSIFISTLTLMAIAIDRYFVIVHHSSSSANVNDHMSMPMCIAIITLIWTASLLLVMPYAVHMRLTHTGEPCNVWVCVEDWAMDTLKSVYGAIVMALQFVVPFVIIGFSYTQIWKFLNNRSSMVSQRESEYENSRKKRLLRMLIIMVVVFGACWFPFNLLNILRDLRRLDGFIKSHFTFIFLIAHVISMTATCWNPIVYAWMNENFRERFVAAVPFLRRWFPNSRRSRPRIVTDCDVTTDRSRYVDHEFKTQSIREVRHLCDSSSANNIDEEKDLRCSNSSNFAAASNGQLKTKSRPCGKNNSWPKVTELKTNGMQGLSSGSKKAMEDFMQHKRIRQDEKSFNKAKSQTCLPLLRDEAPTNFEMRTCAI